MLAKLTTCDLCFLSTRAGSGFQDLLSDNGNDERVIESSILEVLGSVVKDEVNTGQLLQTLEEATSHEALADVTLEAIEIRGFRQAHLVAVVGLNLGELLDESRVGDVETAELAESAGRGFVLVLLDEVARSFW